MATVDGQQVKVGDTVCFKADVEQCGTIMSFKSDGRHTILVLGSKYGFQGEYIGGQTTTQQRADDCWIE